MSNISLDILTWNDCRSKFGKGDSFEVYIKLNMKTGTKFYMYVENELLPISEQHYNRLRPSLYFNITSRNLKELKLDAENPLNQL